MTRVELNTFTYAKGLQSLSIDKAILAPIPKRLLFAIVDKGELLGSLTTKPFKFQHFDMTFFTLYVNGKQIPSGGLRLDIEREKGSVMAYRTIFEGSGIRHSNSGLQISHASFLNGYSMLVFDLTPVRAHRRAIRHIPTAVI